jgi:hypothetical protein
MPVSATNSQAVYDALKACGVVARVLEILAAGFSSLSVRLKRPACARSEDGTLGFDPYRTYIGMSEGKFALTLVALILGGTLLVISIVVVIIGALKPGG